VRRTNAIYDALERFPRLLDNFKVEPLPASRRAKFPLELSAKQLGGIAGRMFKSNQRDEAAECQEKLLDISRCFPGGLLEFLRDKCADATTVHAELQLLDYARHEKVEFVDNDKYIGCSKPACYMCYHYILALAPEYHTVVPPSHYKLYPGWRAPDVPKHRGEAAAKIRNNVMDKMNEVFRADLIREIDERRKRPHQFDSTTGMGIVLKDMQRWPASIHEVQASSAGDALRPTPLQRQGISADNYDAFRAHPVHNIQGALADNYEAVRPAPVQEDDPAISTNTHEAHRDDMSFDSRSGNASDIEEAAAVSVTADLQSSVNRLSLTSGLDLMPNEQIDQPLKGPIFLEHRTTGIFCPLC